MSTTRKARTVGVFAMMLLTLMGANFATAKGPIPTPPPVSMYLTTQTGQDIKLTQPQADSIGRLIRSIPQSYNDSWRPAILDLTSKSSQNIIGQWIDHIRLDIAQKPNGRYNLTVFLGTVVNGSESEVANRSYPADSAFTQLLTKLNSSFGIEFSVFGAYLSDLGAGEFFFFIDPYFHHFNAVDGPIAQSLTTGLAGKSFSWLTIALLDQNAIRVDWGSQSSFPNTVYYGTGTTAGTVATVVTTTTVSSTTTLPPIILSQTQTLTQVTTATMTVTAPQTGPNSSVPNYNGYLILAVFVVLIGSVSAVVYSRKK